MDCAERAAELVFQDRQPVRLFRDIFRDDLQFQPVIKRREDIFLRVIEIRDLIGRGEKGDRRNGIGSAFIGVELYKARQAILPAQEKLAEKQFENSAQEKLSLIMLLSAKQETSHLLGADAEERQARQLIMHRNQEQYRNSLSKRKRNDPER